MREKPPNIARSLLLVHFFHIHSKTSACGACRALPPKHRRWQMRRSRDGAAVGDWQGSPATADKAGHRKKACETSSSLSFKFLHVIEELPSPFLALQWSSSPFAPVSSRCHPLQYPKCTRFCLFQAFPGAFFSFSLFFTQGSRTAFVHFVSC